MKLFINRSFEIAKDVTKEILREGFPTGVYTAVWHPMAGQAEITSVELTTDDLVDFPDSNYKIMLKEVQTFFTDKCKQTFKKLGFTYKKAVLLYGKPGTGKTCLVIRLSNEFSKTYKDGVTLFNPDLESYEIFREHLPKEIPLLCIFEEFDSIIFRQEESFLGMLDGELQRPNTFYLFTTNFLEKIDHRMLRPGRISNTVEIKIPSKESRLHYLKAKLPELEDSELNRWVEKTDKLTVDELKASVLMTQCYGYSLDQTLLTIKRRKGDKNEW